MTDVPLLENSGTYLFYIEHHRTQQKKINYKSVEAFSFLLNDFLWLTHGVYFNLLFLLKHRRVVQKRCSIISNVAKNDICVRTD